MMGQELFEHPKKQYKTYGITALARYPLTNGIDIGGGHDSLTAALIGTFCWFAGFVFWASRRFTKSTGRQ